MATAALPGAPVRAPAAADAITRAEIGVLALVVAAALSARVLAFGATGLTHFDEGVYAISATGVALPPHDLFPNQINFSPPFYFTITGVVLWLVGGEPDRAAVMVNIVLGTLTVVSVWWLGRAWFGARAGIIAAALLALSQFHILMSRVVLTDAAFALWFVLAIGATVAAVDRGDFRLAVVAGVLTGLAWNTKYHGWFVPLIAGVALAPTLWRARRTGGWRRPLGVWATAAAVAAVLYLPWAVYIRMNTGGGGYGSIISYYSTMLRTDWLGNVARQAGQQAYLEGWLTRAAAVAALGAGLAVRAAGASTARVAAATAALGAGALAVGQAGVAAVLAVLAVPLLLRELHVYRSRVLICWIGLWAVAAPIYHPYARLILPFTIATFLLAGLAIDRFLGAGARPRRGHAALALAGAAAVAAMSIVLRDDAGDPWSDARGLASAAQAIDGTVPANAPIYVVGEPPLVHYLHRAGRTVPARMDLAVLDTISREAYLITGVYTRRAPPLRDGIEERAARLTPLGMIPFDPNDLRLLDDFRPERARAFRAARDTTFDLRLYRVAPARATSPAGPGS